jgi:hypothetical protein
VATRRWPPSADQAIEAFVRWLNADRGAAYEIDERPDTRERTLPAIDYVLRDPRKHYEAAVEVSSVWRSEDAGKEDAYIAKWFESARKVVAGRVPGVFYLTLPISVPRGAKPERFGEALVDTINQNHAAIVEAGKQGKMLPFTVAGLGIWIFQLPIKAKGSDIDYARSMPDMKDFPSRVGACLDEKAPKLRPYSDSGVETWIVVYNTMGVAMSPFEAERIVIEECGPLHEHVAHIVLITGNPPDDAWVQVVR